MPYAGKIIEIPIGFGGLDYRENQNDVLPKSLIQAENVKVYKGIIKKDGGSANQNTQITGSPAIVGGTEYWPDPDNQLSLIHISEPTRPY